MAIRRQYVKCKKCGVYIKQGEICECLTIEELTGEPLPIMELLHAPEYIFRCINYFLFNNHLPDTAVELTGKQPQEEENTLYNSSTNTIYLYKGVIIELAKLESLPLQVEMLVKVMLHEMCHQYNHIHRVKTGKEKHGILYAQCAEKHGLIITAEAGKVKEEHLNSIAEKLVKYICGNYEYYYKYEPEPLDYDPADWAD